MLGSGLQNIPIISSWGSLSFNKPKNHSKIILLNHNLVPKKPHFKMLKPIICGTFHHEEDDDDEPWNSPRKSRKNSSGRRHNNPYSSRGLDKFSALLADLEEKRKKIYSQKGSQDISFVRFVYSNSDDCVPIVVKSKVKNQEKTKPKLEDIKEKSPKDSTEIFDLDIEEEVKQPILDSNKKTEKKRFSWNMKLYRLRRPSYYLPLVIVMILLFLAVFGRSFAILCTCIGWYIVPTLKNGSSIVKRPKKKDYVRRFSENKMVSDGLSSPKSNTNSGAVKDQSSGQHGHNNSW